MLNFEVVRVYLQQLEYKMYRTDFPVDYILFLIGYYSHPNLPYAHIQIEQAVHLIPSHFQEEDHSFIHDTLFKKYTIGFHIFCLQT